MLYVATQVRSDVTAEALKEALLELKLVRDPKLGKPINDEEIARARADLVQSLGARLEHGARIGSSLAELWLHQLQPDYYRQYPKLLGAENPDTLTRAASVIDPQHLVMLIVGDRQVIEAPLRKLGFEVLTAPAELSE
jgi:zinc protease